jgi:hypothetical protein
MRCFASGLPVNPVTSNTIDLVEFVYDLDVKKDDWVPSLLEVGSSYSTTATEWWVRPTCARPTVGCRFLPSSTSCPAHLI